MEANEATQIVADCAAMREQPRANYTVPEAIADALWLERTPDAVVSRDRLKQIIATLHAGLQASPCYYKGAREGIPTFTILAYDRAGHAAIRHWADLADDHGARATKYESARAMVTEWLKRTDLRWPT